MPRDDEQGAGAALLWATIPRPGGTAGEAALGLSPICRPCSLHVCAPMGAVRGGPTSGLFLDGEVCDTTSVVSMLAKIHCYPLNALISFKFRAGHLYFFKAGFEVPGRQYGLHL